MDIAKSPFEKQPAGRTNNEGLQLDDKNADTGMRNITPLAQAHAKAKPLKLQKAAAVRF